MTDPVKARTRQMHATLRRRSNVYVPPLEHLREHFAESMRRRPLCPYCNAKLSADAVSLDHVMPLSRGGSNDLANIVYCCPPCNKAKGKMSGGEYYALLRALDEVSAEQRNPRIREWVLTALKVAASFRIGANRRAKKL